MKLSEQLKKKADQLVAASPELTALGLIKAAGKTEDEARTELAQADMEKTAAARMVEAGIDYDSALEMVKAAGVKVAELPGFKPKRSEAEALVAMLTKAASQVAKLEDEVENLRSGKEELLTKVASLEDILDNVPEQVETPSSSLVKLAEAGIFDAEDMEALAKVDSKTLAKFAQMAEQPWSMGKAAGIDLSATDPLTAWLMA